jgi:DNA repair exonuclease SbcCD ATPase subunit
MATIERDGLPLYLLKTKLPMIETDINGLLSAFLDKTLVLRVEEKDVVVGIEVQPGTSQVSNYLGGMESFIIDLSLKLGFSKFANLPRSNFFIIDEGISVMDQERIGNISHLFDFLSHITDHVFLISHLPAIKDFVQQSIEILKDPTSQKSRLLVT